MDESKKITLKQIEKMLTSKETSILQDGVKKLLALQLKDKSLDFESSFSKVAKNIIDNVKASILDLKKEIIKIKEAIPEQSKQEETKERILVVKPKTEDSILIKTLSEIKVSNESLLTSGTGMLSSIFGLLKNPSWTEKSSSNSNKIEMSNQAQYSDFRDEQQEQESIQTRNGILMTLNNIYELLVSRPEKEIEEKPEKESSETSGTGLLSSIFGLLKNPSWIQKLFAVGKVVLGIGALVLGSKTFYDGIMSSIDVLGRNLDLSKLGDWGEALKLGFGNIVSSITGLPLKSIYDGITNFQNYLSELWNSTIGGTITPILENYQALMDEYGGYITRIATFVYDIPSYLMQGLGWALEKLGFSFGEKLQEFGKFINLGEALQKLLAHPLDFLQKIVGNIYTYVSAIASYLGSWGGLKQGFTKSFSDALK